MMTGRLLPLVVAYLLVASSAAAQPLSEDVTPSGRLHLDMRLPLSQTADEIGEFFLRRARLGLNAALSSALTLELEADVAGVPEVTEAVAQLRLPHRLLVQAGRFKAPVGLEELRSSNALWFVERGFPTTLVPGRDVGLGIELTRGPLLLQAAMQNGALDGADALTDTGPGKDGAVRLWVTALERTDASLGFGLSGAVGLEGTTETPVAVPDYKAPGVTLLDVRDEVTTSGWRWRAVPQLLGRIGALSVMGESAVSNHPIETAAGSDRLMLWASQLAVSWIPTGEPSLRDPPAVARPLSAGGPGLWRFSARAQHFTALAPPNGLLHPGAPWSRACGAELGVTWRPETGVRLLTTLSATHQRTDDTDDSQTSWLLLNRMQVDF